MDIAEINRRLENIVRHGKIFAVDTDACRVRVKSGGTVTEWLPWYVPAAGEDTEWRSPSIGEQAIVLCPSGEPTVGFVFCGFFSTQFPAPDNSASKRVKKFRDGAVIEYDTATHTLNATLPENGTANLVAPGGATVLANVDVTGDVSITGNLSVNGDITATGDIAAQGDVVAGTISLKQHKHSGVMSGPSVTGLPQ